MDSDSVNFILRAIQFRKTFLSISRLHIIVHYPRWSRVIPTKSPYGTEMRTVHTTVKYEKVYGPWIHALPDLELKSAQLCYEKYMYLKTAIDETIRSFFLSFESNFGFSETNFNLFLLIGRFKIFLEAKSNSSMSHTPNLRLALFGQVQF